VPGRASLLRIVPQSGYTPVLYGLLVVALAELFFPIIFRLSVIKKGNFRF
jgi:hypothetical protein